MDVTSDKRRQARELADEFLGRGAGIARAAVGPLGTAGRVVFAAGAVLWLAGPAPFWGSAPHPLAAAILLIVLLAPGLRLLRHQRRMQVVLEDLPDLVNSLSTALEETRSGLAELHGDWRETARPGRTGLFATGRRCFTFYRRDLAPLRNGPGKVIEQVTDTLGAFSGPAVFLSAVALLVGMVEIAISPIAVIFRLFN